MAYFIVAVGWSVRGFIRIPCCKAMDLCLESECDADEIEWIRPIWEEGNLPFYLSHLFPRPGLLPSIAASWSPSRVHHWRMLPRAALTLDIIDLLLQPSAEIRD